jgi:hypothetical protein
MAGNNWAEDTMRLRILTGLVSVLLAVSILPANAQWKSYVSKEAGFSFLMPGEMKAEKTAYKSSAGDQPATVYSATDDNIVYRVTVIEVGGQAEAEAVKGAAASFVADKKVMADAEARVERNMGRKMTADLPNDGGRSMAAIYYKNNRLIQLDVTVLPANGDFATPDTGRFIDSIAFGDDRFEADATELKLQK